MFFHKFSPVCVYVVMILSSAKQSSVHVTNEYSELAVKQTGCQETEKFLLKLYHSAVVTLHILSKIKKGYGFLKKKIIWVWKIPFFSDVTLCCWVSGSWLKDCITFIFKGQIVQVIFLGLLNPLRWRYHLPLKYGELLIHHHTIMSLTQHQCHITHQTPHHIIHPTLQDPIHHSPNTTSHH